MINILPPDHNVVAQPKSVEGDSPIIACHIQNATQVAYTPHKRGSTPRRGIVVKIFGPSQILLTPTDVGIDVTTTKGFLILISAPCALKMLVPSGKTPLGKKNPNVRHLIFC